MLTHQGLSNVILASILAFAIGPETRLLQHASISFDNSIWEILMALIGGAVLCLGSHDTMFAGDELGLFLLQQGVTTAILTPSVLAIVPPGAYPALSTLMVGGESCSAELAARWSQRRRFFNTYGPTEATIHTTLKEYTEQLSLAPAIGRPNDNIETYVLDVWLQPVPLGIPGELYIGGIGVARGYLNRPALTAESFLPHPWSALPGARLYRTGDLVRLLPTGDLEFLGRIDQQVKIHGVRIEPGEIEVTLNAHPQISEAIVLVEHEASDTSRLVAFFVSQAGALVPAGELRHYLLQKLPSYMVPTAFVQLDTFPLTPAGKVDRKVLLDSSPALQSISVEAFVAPRTHIEEVLVVLWAQVLKLKAEQIGIHDNFFALGGHSLLATQAVSRIRSVFLVELPLRKLFEAPTVAQLALQITAILQGGVAQIPAPSSLLSEMRPDLLPLSSAQERLWFLYQLDPQSTAYSIPNAFHLRGSLVIEALERSLNVVVQRHEVLRTTFVMSQKYPVQIIATNQVLVVPLVDLSDLPISQREQEVRCLISQENHRPFDLQRGPLLRAAVLRLQAQEHELLFTIHHIISDAWSTSILVREFTELYRGYIADKAVSLPALPLQYADYALWQQQWLQSEVLQRQLDYWRQQLDDAPAVLHLPTDRPRSVMQSSVGAVQKALVPAQLQHELNALSQRESVTLFMTLLAAFQVLLMRYSGQEDIMIGTPIANRRYTEFEHLIGCFINTLVLRADLSGRPRFQELLARVREVTLGAYTHQDVPFEQLVEALQPVRSLSYSPFFQVMFILQNAPQEELRLEELTLHAFELEECMAKFDLTLQVHETEQGLLTVVEYNTDLFNHSTIGRLLEHWQILLQGIVAHPETHLDALPLLSSVEQTLLLQHWNATQHFTHQTQVLSQLFEGQVQRTPDAIAVVFEELQLTYQEFNWQANHLSRRLRAAGVGPEALVGICLPRSIDMVIALLAVLKSGGAYVPLDPSYPRERLAYMLLDAQVDLVLTQVEAQPYLTGIQVRVLCVDTSPDRSSFNDSELGNETIGIHADNLAYIIYTSGSTGQPKGVMNTHRGVADRLHWIQDTYALGESDRVLQKTSLSFDVSVLEIFWPWLAGATLVISRSEGQQDPAYLRECIRERGVTTVSFVPAMLQAFLQDVEVEACRSLRQVISTGEALSPQVQEHFFTCFPENIRFSNLYGPTEAAIEATFWDCQMGQDSQTVPIGRPIWNTQIYLLDAAWQPVPIGVPGELYIGGVGLARGYWQRPDLTAERFLPHPFGQEPGERLYKTGDLARYREDGAIEYLGRLDSQVKLRGFRIELGEIETVLLTHPGVREAAVVLNKEDEIRQHLVAYVVMQGKEVTTTSQLQKYLRERLPHYMVPAFCVFLDAMPLSPSGKVNRQSLLQQDWRPISHQATYIAPQTRLQERLAVIWMELLDIPRIGANDNFFEHGGHSLLLTHLMMQINANFKVDVPLRRLFEMSTLAEMAQAIEQVQVEQLQNELLEQGDSEEELAQMLAELKALGKH